MLNIGEDGAHRYYMAKNDTRLHRLGGPAVCYPDGVVEWWLYGYQLDNKSLVELHDALSRHINDHIKPPPDWGKIGPIVTWGATPVPDNPLQPVTIAGLARNPEVPAWIREVLKSICDNNTTTP